MFHPPPDPLRRHAARQLGQGETTLVFAHGYGCDQTVWTHILPAFAQNHRVVTFDHAGAGACDPGAYDNFRHSALAGYAEDLVEICAALRAPRLVLVGHSVSAMIAALAGIMRPDLFARIVMIGPSACYLNDGAYRGGFERPELEEFLDLLETNFLGWSKILATLAMGSGNRPELAEDLSARICRTDPLVASVFARVTFFSDLRDTIGRLRVPTSILQCHDDPIAPDSAAAFVHDSLPGSQLVRLEATGHCPHLSHPHQVIAGLGQILAGGA